MLVSSRTTTEVLTVTPDTTLSEALALTRERGIRHLPVVDGRRLVGLVTDRDLRLAMPPPWADTAAQERFLLGARTVTELMTSDVRTIGPDMPVEVAARFFIEDRIGCLPVMENGELVGILTASDLLRALTTLFGGTEPSTRLELMMPNRPGELSRVVRLIGIDFRTNITGMVMPPHEESGTARVIIHVATRDPTPIVEALRQMGYEVDGATH
jgi:acetoin utilization protein AcuB